MDVDFHSERFREAGFQNEVVSMDETNQELKLRTNIHSEDDFVRWKGVYCLVGNMTLNVLKAQRSTLMEDSCNPFIQHLICQHGTQRHKGVKKTSTSCPLRIKVVIKRVTARKKRGDKLLATMPCFITISHGHNHETTSAAALRQLRVLPNVEAAFHVYFRGGMGPTEAYHHHQMKMAISDSDWLQRARADINPTRRAVEYIHAKWQKSTSGGSNDADTFAALDNFAKDSDNIVEKEVLPDGSCCVVLVTPLMARVHDLRESSEVVFVEAAAYVKRLKTAVIPFLCASPVGALPLGVVFTSSRDEWHLTTGFRLLTKAMGDKVFNGQGHPAAFMTDNCGPVRNALQCVWPEATQYLGVFHLLHQTWRWLLDSKHGVAEDKRQRLLAIVKQLAYAETPTDFQSLLDRKDVSHDGFARYLADLVERRAQWALAYRSCALLRGLHTNSYAEATMYIIKDIVKNRSKARNVSKLVICMAEIYSGYVSQRLIDMALGQSRNRSLAKTAVSDDAIVHVDDANFEVASESDPEQHYRVDLAVGTCTCPNGNSGTACEHQVACAQLGAFALPQHIIAAPDSRQCLMRIAVGDAKAQTSFLRGLQPTEPDEEEVVSGETKPDITFVTESSIPAEEPNDGFSAWDGADDFAVDDHDEHGGERDPLSLGRPSAEKTTAARIVAFLEVAKQTLVALGDDVTDEALARHTDAWRKLRTSAELNSFLLPAPRVELSRADAGGGQVGVQPTSIGRWPAEEQRCAVPLPRVRRPAEPPAEPAKRRRHLSACV